MEMEGLLNGKNELLWIDRRWLLFLIVSRWHCDLTDRGGWRKCYTSQS